MSRVVCVICGGKSRRIKLKDGRSFPSPACRDCAAVLDRREQRSRVNHGRRIKPGRNKVRWYRVRWRKSKWLKALLSIERKLQKEDNSRTLSPEELSEAALFRYGEDTEQHRQQIQEDAKAGKPVYISPERVEARHKKQKALHRNQWDKAYREFDSRIVVFWRNAAKRNIRELVAEDNRLGGKRIFSLLTKRYGVSPLSLSSVHIELRKLKAA